MTETAMVSTVCSKVIYGDTGKVFILPQEICITPHDIYDDKQHVYRIAIGKPDITPEEAAMYKPFFDLLDKSPFISNLYFYCGDVKLTFDLAYIMKTVQSFGIFYDIEAAEMDIHIEKGNNTCN